MRFSVIIPAHNEAGKIVDMLESIRKQTYKDYELIVVCDACTDLTEKIAVNGYNAKTYNIDAHSDGAARNKGIEMATGEYLIFADADDWFLHECVFQQINDQLNELKNQIDVLCFSFMWKDRGYMKPKDNYGRGYWTAVWTKVWRREFVKDVKFPHTPRFSDVVFTNEVLAKKPRIIEWDCPLYYYNFKQKVIKV